MVTERFTEEEFLESERPDDDTVEEVMEPEDLEDALEDENDFTKSFDGVEGDEQDEGGSIR